jgi:hypothetical protein
VVVRGGARRRRVHVVLDASVKGKGRTGVQRQGVQGAAEHKANLTVRLTNEAMQIVIREAAENGLTRTAVVELALRAYSKLKKTKT